MDYRLVRIYDKADSSDYRIRIEVCYETRHKSLPPFLRRISLDRLYKDYAHKSIISLINQSDAGEQSPFVISNNDYLSFASIHDVMESMEWSYIQSSRHASLRKGTIVLKRKLVTSGIEKGKIIAAELYINDVKSWHRDVRIMFRYENVNSSFYPFANIREYVKDDGSISIRDFDLEMLYLDLLRPYYNADTGEMTLDLQDCSDILYEIINKGWTLYVAKTKDTYARVYSHITQSGIHWFSTSEVDEREMSNMLLDSFLKNRNYIESNGNISLINSKDVLRSDGKALVSVVGAPQNILLLYNNDNTCPFADLKEKLKSRVCVSLRPYQIEGVEWLLKKREAGAGCLLADEMGLGKTLQVISHLACLDNAGQHLIIVPTSLLFNWKNEVEKFAPQLFPKLTIVSYDIIRIHLEDYLDKSYDTIVIDEAQLIKNRETKRYKAISQLKCRHKIILTGTPIENSVEDMWSHFLMLNPDMRIVHNNIIRIGGQNRDAIVELTAKILNPFILRRTKTEKLRDLPKRTEETVYVELSPKERTIYDGINKMIVEALRNGVSGRVTSIALEGLLRLRQVCVSANMLSYALSKSSKFTSTKLSTALGFISEIKAEGHKVLVFSQFVKALEEMESILKKNDINFVTLYGSTKNRNNCVKRFQEDPNVTVFLISLKAGGVGLNLTSADRVILLDDWWNPAVEDQAMGRTHRIGQKNNVHVIRLVCSNTVEEKILLLQKKKQYISNLFAITNGSLTIEELREIIEW